MYNATELLQSPKLDVASPTTRVISDLIPLTQGVTLDGDDDLECPRNQADSAHAVRIPVYISCFSLLTRKSERVMRTRTNLKESLAALPETTYNKFKFREVMLPMIQYMYVLV